MKNLRAGSFRVLFCLVLAIFIGATVSSSSLFAAGDYRIKEYNVDVNLTKDNTYQVTENIRTEFTTPKRGIYRYIPYRFKDLDGMFPRIENLRVENHPFTTSSSTEGDAVLKEIKIGDADKFLTGPVDYKISFDYLVGAFRNGHEPSIYYTLMGNMATDIENGSFTLKVPKSIDGEQIKLYQGGYGSTEEIDTFKYDEEKLEITGFLTEPLGSTDFLTIKIPVDASYFADAPVLLSQYEFFIGGLIGLGAVLLILSFLVFFFFGRDKKIIPVVEFYPPENITPLDLRKIINEDMVLVGDIKPASTLFYYLANKGYLAIDFKEDKDFTITRTEKPMAEDEKTHVKVFLEGVFKDKEVLNKKDFDAKYYETAVAALTTVEDPHTVDKTSVALKWLMTVLSCIPIAIGTLMLIDHLGSGLYVAILGVLILVSMSILLAVGSKMEKASIGLLKGPKRGIFFYWLIAILSGALLALMTGLLSFLFLLLLFYLTIFVSLFIKRRNPEKMILLGRVKGFENFIRVAKKNELEKLLEEHPTYFYDVLPYAQVLGISKMWIDKFKEIEMLQPEWTSSSSMGMPFSILYLSVAMNSIDKAVSSSTQAYSKTTGGIGGFGGGGGGGFSGGGFGGGGGGSW